MRIVISTYDHSRNPHYAGGGAKVVDELARRLARADTVTVICGSYRGSRPQVEGNVRYVFLPVGWIGPRLGHLLFHALLPWVALIRRYDVWIESFTPPFSTSFLPLVTRRPVIGLAQMLCGREFSRRYRFPFWRIERRGLRVYRSVIALNPADAATVAELSPATTVTTLTNGVDLPPEPETYGTGRYALYLGRIDIAIKGLDLLVQAQVRARRPLPLVIAGQGTPSDVARLRRIVARHPTAGIRLAGRVDGPAKHDLLRGCAFLVLPSRTESFGLSLLEAMSYGKPAVSFALEQLRWAPATATVQVPLFDTTALADILDRLAHNRMERARLGRAGRAAAATNYSWDQVTDEYRTIIASVVASAGRRPCRQRSYRQCFYRQCFYRRRPITASRMNQATVRRFSHTLRSE